MSMIIDGNRHEVDLSVLNRLATKYLPDSVRKGFFVHEVKCLMNSTIADSERFQGMLPEEYYFSACLTYAKDKGFFALSFTKEDIAPYMADVKPLSDYSQNLGSFTVDVRLQPDGKYDIWIAHEGSSGAHYQNVTLDQIGSLLADEIGCVRSERTGLKDYGTLLLTNDITKEEVSKWINEKKTCGTLYFAEPYAQILLLNGTNKAPDEELRMDVYFDREELPDAQDQDLKSVTIDELIQAVFQRKQQYEEKFADLEQDEPELG